MLLLFVIGDIFVYGCPFICLCFIHCEVPYLLLVFLIQTYPENTAKYQ